jgi:hypothetical protein
MPRLWNPFSKRLPDSQQSSETIPDHEGDGAENTIFGANVNVSIGDEAQTMPGISNQLAGESHLLGHAAPTGAVLDMEVPFDVGVTSDIEDLKPETNITALDDWESPTV